MSFRNLVIANTFALALQFFIENGHAQCNVCAAGQYRPGGNASAMCISCPDGYFQENSNATFCKPASSGFEISSEKTYQTPCPVGKYKPEIHGETCKACPLGYFQDSLNATVCHMIDGGYHAPSKLAGASQQIECPPGTFSIGHALECTSCPLGWSQPDYRSTTCLKCRKGKSTLGNGSRICIGKDCKAGEYLNDTYTEFSKWTCEVCPKGAVCDAVTDATWSSVIAREGYYRMPGPAPQAFVKCETASACVGFPSKGNMTEGCNTIDGFADKLLCARCLPRYAKSSAGFCQKCVNAFGIFLFGIFCFFAFIIYLFMQMQSAMKTNSGESNTIDMDLLKILMNSFYCFGVLTSFPISFPSTMSPFLMLGKTVTSAGSDIMSVECLLPYDMAASKYLMKSVFALVIPLAAICISGALFSSRYFIRRFCQYVQKNKKQLRRRRGTHHVDLSQFRKGLRLQFLLSVVIIFFATVPSMNSIATSMMVCARFGPEYVLRLRDDPEVLCWESEHLAYFLSAALPAHLLYTVAVPLQGILTLRRYATQNRLWKHHSQDPDANVFLFLYSGYTRSAYFWEFIILARKIAFNMLLVATTDGQYIGLFSIIILHIAAILQLHFKPYRHSLLNFTETGSLRNVRDIRTREFYSRKPVGDEPYHMEALEADVARMTRIVGEHTLLKARLLKKADGLEMSLEEVAAKVAAVEAREAICEEGVAAQRRRVATVEKNIRGFVRREEMEQLDTEHKAALGKLKMAIAKSKEGGMMTIERAIEKFAMGINRRLLECNGNIEELRQRVAAPTQSAQAAQISDWEGTMKTLTQTIEELVARVDALEDERRASKVDATQKHDFTEFSRRIASLEAKGGDMQAIQKALRDQREDLEKMKKKI
eukprot:g1679.t1